MAPMAVLTVFVLWLVLAAATEQRRGEVAVARLRGRGPAGAVGLLLVELLPVLLLGVVPGAAAALLGGALARALLPGAAPFEAGPGFATAVLLAVVAVVLTTVAAAVRVAREPLDGLVRRGRVPSGRWALGALDAFLIAVVGTGVLAFVTGSLSGPFALAGPALLALLAGLLLAHLAAPTASAWGRRLLRRGRLVAGVTLLEMGRRRETRAVIAVITVASALAVFAVDARVVGERNRSQRERARRRGAGGAPARGARPRRGARGAGRRRPHRPSCDAGHGLPHHPGRGARRIPSDRVLPARGADRRAVAGDRTPGRGAGGADGFAHLAHRADRIDELTAKDVLGSDSEVDLSLVVTTGTGDAPHDPPRRDPAARRADDARRERLGVCERLPAGGGGVHGRAGVEVDGELDLSDLRVDGRPVDWGSSAEDWNTTEDEHAVIRPSSTRVRRPASPAEHPGHLSRRAHPGMGAPHGPRPAARRAP